MRLLHIQDDDNVRLVEFFGTDIPAYAILSHTWGQDNEEVNYQDLVKGTGKEKRGYRKIKFCAQQARKDGLRYFWVDTCCSLTHYTVDKSSSAELTESINSMFLWYERADVCYVFLEDLPRDLAPPESFEQCRWFSRGWTLQELLAPKTVKFYDKLGRFQGTKQEHAAAISSFTDIPTRVLLHRGQLSETSVSAKMRWASRRTTKRLEDKAYSLLGIFGVNMPLIYGEGSKAFIRLQEEIIKRSNDLTMFAWNHEAHSKILVGMFASSPDAFTNVPDITTGRHEYAEFALTNRGLHFVGGVTLQSAWARISGNSHARLYLFFTGFPDDLEGSGGIWLRKLAPHTFGRLGQLPLTSIEHPFALIEHERPVTSAYIMSDQSHLTSHDYESLLSRHRRHALHIPKQKYLKLRTVAPTTLWDYTDNIFLKPKSTDHAGYPVVLFMVFVLTWKRLSYPITVLYVSSLSAIKVFDPEDYPLQYSLLMREKYQAQGISWETLMSKAPGLESVGSSFKLRLGDTTLNLRFREGTSEIRPLYSEGAGMKVRTITSSIH